MGEVLYDELKPELRKELHKRLADSLSSEVFPTLALQQAIGQHYIAGGQPDKAYQVLTNALLQSWNRGLVRPAKHLLSLVNLNRKARPPLTRGSAKHDTSF